MHGRGAGRSPENFGGKLLSLGEILHSKNASHCVGKLIMQCIHFCKGYICNIKDWGRSRPIMGSVTANLSSECVTSTMTPGTGDNTGGLYLAKVHRNDRSGSGARYAQPCAVPGFEW